MARRYSVSFTDVAVTAQQDLFQLEANTVPATLERVVISQRSDMGDAAAEGLSILIRRVTDAVTNDVAEVALDSGDAAANADLAVNETTELVTGATNVHSENWNIALPFDWYPAPEHRVTVEVGNAITVNLNTTPADELTMSGTLYFSEGGS